MSIFDDVPRQPGLGDAEPCAAAERLLHIRELSPREREVLWHAALGAPDQKIADRMLVAHRTVRAYLTAIFHKLGARSRVEVALTGVLAHVALCDACLLTLSVYRAHAPADGIRAGNRVIFDSVLSGP